MFQGTHKYIETRQLAMFEVLGQRTFSLAWYILHVGTGLTRFESQDKFLKSFIDVVYYGCPGRISSVTLPAFFDLENDEIKNAMWNPHKNSKHLTMKNDNFAVVLLQAMKTHCQPYLKRYYGTGSVFNRPGLKYYVTNSKKLSNLIDDYDDKWRQDKYMCRIVEIINNIRSSPLSFCPHYSFGFTRLIREAADSCMIFLFLLFFLQTNIQYNDVKKKTKKKINRIGNFNLLG